MPESTGRVRLILSPASIYIFFNQSMTSLVLKIKQRICSICNVVRTKEKIPMLAKLLSEANEGRSLTSLHAGIHGDHSLNTSSPFRKALARPDSRAGHVRSGLSPVI